MESMLQKECTRSLQGDTSMRLSYHFVVMRLCDDDWMSVIVRMSTYMICSFMFIYIYWYKWKYILKTSIQVLHVKMLIK